MVYVSTSEEKARILKNDKPSLKEEINAKARDDLRIAGLVPKHGQDEYKVLEDMKEYGEMIREADANSRERTRQRQKEERERKRRTYDENLRLYFMQLERKGREKFDSNTVKFGRGGLDGLENCLRALGDCVLARILPPGEKDGGIFLAASHNDRFLKCLVLNAGPKCREVEAGDVVVPERFEGRCIDCKDVRYLVVPEGKILMKVGKETNLD